jgi:hypothetical protein
MTATDKLAMIETAIAEGRTVYLVTATRATKITPRTFRAWLAAGRPVVKLNAAGSSLLLAAGRHYVCADYVSIRVEGR